MRNLKSEIPDLKSQISNLKSEIVVIGVSLGGLLALQTVLKAMPADFPAAIAIVQHRAADSDERLAKLLQKHCSLPVLEAEDKMEIEPGRVYLAPADYHLLIEDCRLALSVVEGSQIEDSGKTLAQPEISNLKSTILNLKSETCAELSRSIRNHFALSSEAPVNFARPSIDVLFESAAEVYGERGVGVLLTGSNEDGAQGLSAIRQSGGLTIAQDPKTAKARVMPRAAIELNAANYILPLREIGAFLADQFRKQDAGNRKQNVS